MFLYILKGTVCLSYIYSFIHLFCCLVCIYLRILIYQSSSFHLLTSLSIKRRTIIFSLFCSLPKWIIIKFRYNAHFDKFKERIYQSTDERTVENCRQFFIFDSTFWQRKENELFSAINMVHRTIANNSSITCKSVVQTLLISNKCSTNCRWKYGNP